MTKHRDFKRVIRARMEKTGESYAAARRQLMNRKGGGGAGSAHTEADAVPETPDENEYPDLAGMSHEAVVAKTGKDWVQWATRLDEDGALSMTHTEIARHIQRQWPDIGGWWAQSVTVGYERIRGLRLKGQNRASGTFEANKSKTFAVHVERLYEAFAQEAQRVHWCGDEPLITKTCSRPKSVRLTASNGGAVNAYFTDKGPQKSAVAVQCKGLADREDIAARKAAWAARLATLEEWLAD